MEILFAIFTEFVSPLMPRILCKLNICVISYIDIQVCKCSSLDEGTLILHYEQSAPIKACNLT